jgi:UDP-N-acetylglucosamine 2-epimerase (non-hydrolysing)
MAQPLIFLVAGARSSFMKIAPILRGEGAWRSSVQNHPYRPELRPGLNDVFFRRAWYPRAEPDIFMAAGGGTHALQTGKIMIAFEELCLVNRPDAVLVMGDVNSTLACSIVANKLNILVAQV